MPLARQSSKSLLSLSGRLDGAARSCTFREVDLSLLKAHALGLALVRWSSSWQQTESWTCAVTCCAHLTPENDELREQNSLAVREIYV